MNKPQTWIERTSAQDIDYGRVLQTELLLLGQALLAPPSETRDTFIRIHAGNFSRELGNIQNAIESEGISVRRHQDTIKVLGDYKEMIGNYHIDVNDSSGIMRHATNAYEIIERDILPNLTEGKGKGQQT